MYRIYLHTSKVVTDHAMRDINDVVAAVAAGDGAKWLHCSRLELLQSAIRHARQKSLSDRRPCVMCRQAHR
jgi:hypothetical protein